MWLHTHRSICHIRDSTRSNFFSVGHWTLKCVSSMALMLSGDNESAGTGENRGVKSKLGYASSPHGLTSAAFGVEFSAPSAAALSSDLAVALARRCIQRPLPSSAGATTSAR